MRHKTDEFHTLFLLTWGFQRHWFCCNFALFLWLTFSPHCLLLLGPSLSDPTVARQINRHVTIVLKNQKCTETVSDPDLQGAPDATNHRQFNPFNVSHAKTVKRAHTHTCLFLLFLLFFILPDHPEVGLRKGSDCHQATLGSPKQPLCKYYLAPAAEVQQPAC